MSCLLDDVFVFVVCVYVLIGHRVLCMHVRLHSPVGQGWVTLPHFTPSRHVTVKVRLGC